MITLYHGTDIDSAYAIIYNGIDVKCGNKKADFGPGFYTTPDFSHAVSCAKRKSHYSGKFSAVVCMMFDNEAANNIIKIFNDDISWGQFIINNRNSIEYANKMPINDHNFDAKYQITYGRIADYDVAAIAKFLGKINRPLADLTNILNVNYAYQYAFHTADSLRHISNIELYKKGNW